MKTITELKEMYSALEEADRMAKSDGKHKARLFLCEAMNKHNMINWFGGAPKSIDFRSFSGTRGHFLDALVCKIREAVEAGIAAPIGNYASFGVDEIRAADLPKTSIEEGRSIAAELGHGAIIPVDSESSFALGGYVSKFKCDYSSFEMNQAKIIEIAIESLKFAVDKSNKIKDKDAATRKLYELVCDFYQWLGQPVPQNMIYDVQYADKYWRAKRAVNAQIDGLELAFNLTYNQPAAKKGLAKASLSEKAKILDGEAIHSPVDYTRKMAHFDGVLNALMTCHGYDAKDIAGDVLDGLGAEKFELIARTKRSTAKIADCQLHGLGEWLSRIIKGQSEGEE